MTPERERAVEYMSEEMLPTMYDQDPPAKNPPAPKPPVTPVKVATSTAPPALGNTQRSRPQTAAMNFPNVAPKDTPAAGSNRVLYSILIAAVVLFTLSIIIVAILYMMGKI